MIFLCSVASHAPLPCLLPRPAVVVLKATHVLPPQYISDIPKLSSPPITTTAHRLVDFLVSKNYLGIIRELNRISYHSPNTFNRHVVLSMYGTDTLEAH
jgi:hypothetical protein